MRRTNTQPAEGHAARIIAWLAIFAMIAFFWITMAGLVLRVFFRRG